MLDLGAHTCKFLMVKSKGKVTTVEVMPAIKPETTLVNKGLNPAAPT